MNIDDLITQPQSEADKNGAIYNEHIKPTVEQLLALCQEHGLSVIIDVHLGQTADGTMATSFSMAPGEKGNPVRHVAAMVALAPGLADDEARDAFAKVAMNTLAGNNGG